jgi:hypothetical protein
MPVSFLKGYVSRLLLLYPVRKNGPPSFELQRLEFLTGLTRYRNQHPKRLPARSRFGEDRGFVTVTLT